MSEVKKQATIYHSDQWVIAQEKKKVNLKMKAIKSLK